MNAYGIRPHELDQSTQGTPGKYTLCIGENEEDSPWEPLHVELGYPAEADVVCALHTRGCEFISNRTTGDPREILNDIADTISRTGAMPPQRYKRVGLVFGPEHAQLLARNGFTKRAVKEYLAEHTGRPAWRLRQAGRGGATNATAEVKPGVILDAEMPDDGTVADDTLVRILNSPDDILVAVAGAGNAGVTTVVQTLGIAPRHPGRAEIRR
jgi:hypothetical protein